MKRIGFQTLEEVENYLSGDKIQCLLCGKWFIALGQHIAKSHDISIPEYKVKFNIPHSYGLIGAELKQVMRENNKNVPWLAKMA
jgi:predicted transcriptional regulator